MSMTTFGALPAVRISAPDGAHATVTLYGGHLVSWTTADGQERLFCSALSALDGSKAIRGGVPLIFPQFSERGTGLRHGFARIAHWRLSGNGSDDDGAYAEFSLAPSDLPAPLASAWPFAFALTLRVTLHGNRLAIDFTVANTGTQAFPFSAALHSYHQVGDFQSSRLAGLQDVHFSDPQHSDAIQREAVLSFDDKLDRLYRQVPGPLTLSAGDATLQLEQQGFTDAVVWNPGAADSRALNDMSDDEYRRFICIEAALIAPATLAPGQSWSGRQQLNWS
ncbi:D-hexose-6-phosphate mutarotase [Janthinobacterium agaricidamnosum]|uniref:Putative glucose-6-phosphate 1-epimerase n=1 Tax=Janthinobacterium agaricidamnosum NBRC 102515 = DSM 9628 TaxID=1349767 RepID=W0V2L1_9BURK|nr:D-hexose-6-phosphate mutarotase [Janthinobacterium agaricidamnosum]CDG81492.1 aldose 1-epimerase family protein [Janthinobacterium agaricidamnosum NBRC 102515 = DSM 9628]